MLPFENMIADYVKETNNHVLFRVTPVYDGDNLVAKGVQMEAYSVEDDGEGVMFNVFVYNVQPGIEIDYATGESWLSGEERPAQTTNNKNNSNSNKSNNVDDKQSTNSSQNNSVNNSNNSTSNNKNTNTSTNSNANASTSNKNNNISNNSNSNQQASGVIRGNSKSKIYHCPGQANYDDMKDSANLVVFNSEQDAINAGYRKAKR